MTYIRFFAMIATSTVVMFILMYLNTYLLSHIFWSETRAYMAVLMGAIMAIIMLGFMLSMYSSKAINAAIFVGGAVVFAGSLWLVRSQVTVGDTSYMRAMIPHHSIAIMTSSRANISDPRVRKLADEIIFAKDKEIAEMRYLVNDIDTNGDAADEGLDGSARIVDLNEALSSAEIAILDLEFLTGDEIAQLFPDGAICTFKYTDDQQTCACHRTDRRCPGGAGKDQRRPGASWFNRRNRHPEHRRNVRKPSVRRTGLRRWKTVVKCRTPTSCSNSMPACGQAIAAIMAATPEP